MNLTRQMKFYRSTAKNTEVIWKTLSITQLKIIDSIKSPYMKAEMAFEFGKVSGDTPNFLILEQIGLEILNISSIYTTNEQLMEFKVDELRKDIGKDMVIDIIQIIMGAMPSVSFEYLTTLTYNDLLELGVIVERITQKQVFNFDEEEATSLDIQGEHNYFKEDAGKSLQDKMKEAGTI